MRKEFDKDELQRWFSDNYECWMCGKNTWSAFHHADIKGDYSNSLLNAVPICNFECHLKAHSKLRKEENVKAFLKKTLSFLLLRGYVFNDIDKNFIKERYNYYKDIIQENNAIRHEQGSAERPHR